MISINANSLMWQTQSVLHKNPQVVPGTILLLATSLVVYRHATQPHQEHEDVIKKFLAMILVQMLPLAAIEMKIMSCADPVGLFCKFAQPVTLIHGFFLGMRVAIYEGEEYYWSQDISLCCNMAGFVGAVLAIFLGYRQRLLSIVECSAVWALIICALGAALGTTTMDEYFRGEFMPALTWYDFWMTTFETANGYIELVAFVPAVWLIFREDLTAGKAEIESKDTKRISTVFFLYIVGIYVAEDLLSAKQVWSTSRMASMAHVAHFLLLADFACYVLAHIYNPEKLMGALARWLPVDIYHEV